MLIDAFAGSMCCTLIIYFVHHCIKIFNLSLSTSMDPVFQHIATNELTNQVSCGILFYLLVLF